jgi:hypothetical protein
MNNTINLEDYRTNVYFTGQEYGEYVRNSSKLDEIENVCDSVILIIPDKIYSIHPSFFEALLKNVVLKLGKDKFFEKFKIISQGQYDFERALMEAVIRILR